MKNRKDVGRQVLMLVIGVSVIVPLGIAQSDPLNVTANVLATCELGTFADVAFGDLTPGAGVDEPATGTIEWRCSNNASADIAIDNGDNGNRTMTGPTLGDLLPYQLYTDSPGGNVWSDTGTDVTVTGTGMASFTSVSVFGQIAAGAYDDVEFGAYSDTVEVTITIN